MTTKKKHFCLTAQGAKVSAATIDEQQKITLAFAVLTLTPWAALCRKSNIFCLTIQGAKVSAATIAHTVAKERNIDYTYLDSLGSMMKTKKQFFVSLPKEPR